MYVERVVDVDGKAQTLRFKAEGSYYQGMRRVMQVRNEINLSQDGGKKHPEYQHNAAFEEDPFHWTGVGDALYKEHVGAAEFDATGKRWARVAIVFKTELLRCFPEPKAANDPSLNRIIDFLCWYNVNVLTKGQAMHDETKATEGAKVTSAEQHQQDLLYRLLCCPNCRGQKYADEGEEGERFQKIRRAVHDRVQEMNKYFARLVKALNDDVLDRPDDKESFLLKFRKSEPETHDAVREQIYKRWSDMHPPNR